MIPLKRINRPRWTPCNPNGRRLYGRRADSAGGGGQATGEEAVQTARDDAAETLAAFQTEFDTYQADAADSRLAALQAEFDAYKADAETRLAAADDVDLQAVPDADAQKLAALQTEFDAYKADTRGRAGRCKQADAQKLAARQAEFDAFKTDTPRLRWTRCRPNIDTYQSRRRNQAGRRGRRRRSRPANRIRETYKHPAPGRSAGRRGGAYKADAQTALAALQTEYDAFKADSQTEADSRGRSRPKPAPRNRWLPCRPNSMPIRQPPQPSWRTQPKRPRPAPRNRWQPCSLNSIPIRRPPKPSLADAVQAGETALQAAKDSASEELTALQPPISPPTRPQRKPRLPKRSWPSKRAKSSGRPAVRAHGQQRRGQPGTTATLRYYYEGNIYLPEQLSKWQHLHGKRRGLRRHLPAQNVAPAAFPLYSATSRRRIQNGTLYYINNNRLNRLNLENEDAEYTYMKNNMDLYSTNGMHDLRRPDLLSSRRSTATDGRRPITSTWWTSAATIWRKRAGRQRLRFHGQRGSTCTIPKSGTNNIVRYDLVTANPAHVLLPGGGAERCINLAQATARCISP